MWFMFFFFVFFVFFFNDTATSEIYTLSLHDALPISAVSDKLLDLVGLGGKSAADKGKDTRDYQRQTCHQRSEERFSRNAETDLVCRLLLEKKKKTIKSRTNTCQRSNYHGSYSHNYAS